MRLIIILFCLASIANNLQAQSVRKKINFDDNWKFHFGHAADAAKDFNYSIATIFSKSGKAETTAIAEKFDDNSWRSLNLPHDWAVELPFVNVDNFDVMAHGYKPVGGLYPETSIGWYRKKFEIHEADSGKRFSIQFDGIFRDARIWFNGFYLGNNESGYLGVTYDITDYLNFKKQNVLVVRVDASQYEGWFYEGAGIYRHVWLNQHDNVHIANEGVFVYTNVAGNSATVNIEANVVNESLRASGVTIQTYITDRDGKKLAESKEERVSLAVNKSETAKHQIVISNPRLWLLEDPYLYRAVCIVKSDEKIIDQITTKFGVRTIAIDSENGLFLNGKHVKIQGVNCHQDHAGVGSALPDYLQYYRVKLLKELGVNSYRASHNPPTPEFIDACDSLGMLMLDETRLLNSSPEYMDQFERLIKRDRNHPSVFLWSIGNEEAYVQRNSHGKRIALTMMAKQVELDPTRTSTYAADLANVFIGINEVIPIRGFNYREKGMVPYHNDHPSQPVLGTEMGSTVTTRGIYEKDSIRGYVPDQDITHPWWSSLAEEWWPIAADNDWVMGGYVWTGFDYRGEPTPFKWPNISSHFGILDMCGFPKNLYYYYQSWWTEKDVLHISPHWNWKGKEGQNIDVWVNSNAESVELFLNGKSFGKKEMPRNSHLKWSVPYKAGKLEAVAVKNGKKIRTTVQTTDVAYQLVLTPDRTIITADGKDATVINVTALDKKGREVPDVNSLVKFKVTGDAAIIGVGNGDPSCHEADRNLEGNYERSFFNGKCQLILQAGKASGTVQVSGEGAGLQKAVTSIQIK